MGYKKKKQANAFPTQAPVIRKVDSAIHRWFVLLRLIHWIVIYPVYSVIQPLNNLGQSCFLMLKILQNLFPAKKIMHNLKVSKNFHGLESCKKSDHFTLK